MNVTIRSLPLQRSIFRFAGYTLDLDRGALLGADGVERKLRPKSFALLRMLVENAGRLVSRDEILDSVWPGIAVTDDSIGLCIREIRRALDDDRQRLLRTLPRRGYLFAAEMPRPDPLAWPPGPETLVSRDDAPVTAGPPVLAVMPFTNPASDPEQEYLSDGLTEDLITALSHYRWFSVIARGSSFLYKNRAIDVRQVGSALGASYVLEGNVRRAGARLRVTAQLSAAGDGRQIWAQRFESAAEDLFTLEDEVIEAVAAAIEPRLQQAEVARARARPPSSPGAYDLYLQALQLRWQGTREASDEAVALLQRAVAIDAGLAAAWGLLADLAGYRVSQGWEAQGEARSVLQGAYRLAEAGTTDNPSALAWAGYALSFLGKDYAAGLATAERARAAAPHSSQILFLAGYCRIYAGDWSPAVTYLERALRLSPVDPLIGIFYVALSAAHFTGEQYETALEHARTALRTRRDYLIPRRLAASSLAWLGRLDEARAIVADLRAAGSRETIAAIASRTALSGQVRDRFLQGLRRAGLPE